MSNHAEHLRIASLEMSFADALDVMTFGNMGARLVLMELRNFDGDMMSILQLDAKHVYEEKIWELFSDVCGEDLDRFKYHIDMELPCQICGELTVTGPYSTAMSQGQITEHFAARTRHEPNSFWALPDPPQERFYMYPLMYRAA